MGDFQKTKGEIAAIASHASAKTGNRKVLARRTADQNINATVRAGHLQEIIGQNRTQVDATRVTLTHDRTRERFNFSVPAPIPFWHCGFGRTDS